MSWQFDNSYAQLPALMYAQLAPVPVQEPQMVVFNNDLAQQLGLDFSSTEEQSLAALFAGNLLPEGAQPLAQAYAGHQFGHFTMLGDGRAIVLGEHITPDGKRLDIQFKGSGRTPFSRNGDGRAALGPMLREYIMSEAMHGLGIATTRSLAVVATGEPVYREDVLPGAILTRVAASHLRVGTFQYLGMRGDVEAIKTLVHYTLDRHDPQLDKGDNPALTLLLAVMARQVELVINWMRVGFIHGVMNTDNMTISGETIDYGPCAFMDAYSQDTVFSSIDAAGRYRYGNQPHMAKWNLARLAEALLPIIHSDQAQAISLAEEAIESFNGLYARKWQVMMGRKLGLFTVQDTDDALMTELLDQMQQLGLDYTETFRSLSEGQAPPHAALQAWYRSWQSRLEAQTETWSQAQSMMQANNPTIIPRNHKVEEALDAANNDGDLQPMHTLLEHLSNPYATKQGVDKGFLAPPPPSDRIYQTFCGT
ncbi:protein adenylyltransferase SelO [Magnetococcus sp. PR-3]|uniref:protein adenylyltransferase SelO n=1 Tax=Magnetococcus sp. PR-3 TaxID=3120355 RepID=UPI002FCE181F